uniref:Uncharacterized protein n=1 Tax=Tetraodon nigroviridis TaxID=99883 RepID=H3D4R2_TETNG
MVFFAGGEKKPINSLGKRPTGKHQRTVLGSLGDVGDPRMVHLQQPNLLTFLFFRVRLLNSSRLRSSIRARACSPLILVLSFSALIPCAQRICCTASSCLLRNFAPLLLFVHFFEALDVRAAEETLKPSPERRALQRFIAVPHFFPEIVQFSLVGLLDVVVNANNILHHLQLFLQVFGLFLHLPFLSDEKIDIPLN